MKRLPIYGLLITGYVIILIGVSKLYKGFFKVCRKRMEKCLHAKNPSMLIYDLYKLGYYINL